MSQTSDYKLKLCNNKAIIKKLKLDLRKYKKNGAYIAGLPGYPRNFSRDTLLAGLICADADLLHSQIKISAHHQGVEYDPLSGEEPGKIHHEYPGVSLRQPLLTTYNACDTTALFLIGLQELIKARPVRSLLIKRKYREHIQAAVGYLQSHTKNDIFWEYPPEGSGRYSLRVTYWKDSILPLPNQEEPAYPVMYALSHFQAAAGLRSASLLLDNQELMALSERMVKAGIRKFMKEDGFLVMQDKDNTLTQNSSDELHSLFYIPPSFVNELPLEHIATRARTLYTPAGIACTPYEVSEKLHDTYHGYVVWPFEQALIHAGAKKFSLDEVAETTFRCQSHIHEGQELLKISPNISPSGNDQQLWSVAAAMYFAYNEQKATTSHFSTYKLRLRERFFNFL